MSLLEEIRAKILEVTLLKLEAPLTTLPIIRQQTISKQPSRRSIQISLDTLGSLLSSFLPPRSPHMLSSFLTE
jgi:hypothetical protein